MVPPRICSLLLLALVSDGCSTALSREGRCLQALTPQFLAARAELDALEGAWRVATKADPRHADLHSSTLGTLTRLREVRRLHQPTMEGYERVYRRVRRRLEEERLLSEVFWTLAPGPALLLYPLIRWNLRTVFWDGADPDAEDDPIAQYCATVAGPERPKDGD